MHSQISSPLKWHSFNGTSSLPHCVKHCLGVAVPEGVLEEAQAANDYLEVAHISMFSTARKDLSGLLHRAREEGRLAAALVGRHTIFCPTIICSTIICPTIICPTNHMPYQSFFLLLTFVLPNVNICWFLIIYPFFFFKSTNLFW